MSEESIPFREPTAAERRLLKALLQRANGVSVEDDYVGRIRVQPMDDGAMGSFRISVDPGDRHRTVHTVASEVEFTDEDKVRVSVALSVDETGMPIEVDIWKTDFSPLIAIPYDFDEAAQ